MAHTIYDNFYLSNEVEDQYNSHLDLQPFCTVDGSLEGTAGMKKRINVYRATDGTEKLKMGAGNTKSIEVSYSQKEYEILLAQNRFEYYDEQAMTDPNLVPVGVRHMGTDLFNTVNKDIFAEFDKAVLTVTAKALNFDAFVDAMAMLGLESPENSGAFAFVSPADLATLRKSLNDNLQYVQAFALNGYVGTVAGVNIHVKRDAVPGTVLFATKEAVTLFNKKGTETEQPPRSAEDANLRKNTILSRKYYLAALTDETKAVKILRGEAKKSTDTSVQEQKTYYEPYGVGYRAVTPEPEGEDNPQEKGWYEIS